MDETFHIERPHLSDDGTASFRYRLGPLGFTERLEFGPLPAEALGSTTLAKLLDLTAFVLGTSYYKLRAPLLLSAPDLRLTEQERAFVIDVYENGLGEFHARNGLHRFGRLRLECGNDDRTMPTPVLDQRALLPIGGGKDSLVSATLLEEVGVAYAPFAVNPRGPIVSSVGGIGREPVYVRRVLDPEMIRLGKEPGYYNGHVPSTAINSMIAALAAVLFSFNRIVLSNERSASEGNMVWDGREVNHQYSKSLAFEERIAGVLASATGGALRYFSLLRPYSEARIARLFARTPRFDDVFSSCNRNFRYDGHDGPLWCGECPKCHFVFLILAPAMKKDRLVGIFGANLLDRPANEASFRELTGLAGQKPWECVGEILEAAASLWQLTQQPGWERDAVVAALAPDLLTQYGPARLEAALAELMADGPQHHVPDDIAERVAVHAT